MPTGDWRRVSTPLLEISKPKRRRNIRVIIIRLCISLMVVGRRGWSCSEDAIVSLRPLGSWCVILPSAPFPFSPFPWDSFYIQLKGEADGRTRGVFFSSTTKTRYSRNRPIRPCQLSDRFVRQHQADL